MYREKYAFFQNTPLEDVDDETPYIVLLPAYIEIKRYWINTIDYDEKGNERNRQSKARKIKDGEGRRRKLYLNGILRRLMIDGLPFEHLLHCLLNELYYYIDNSTDCISKDNLYRIALSSYRADLAKYKSINRKNDKRKYIVNHRYCIKYGLSKGSVRNLSRKIITYNLIGELYDFELTDKANIEVFNKYGLKISAKTLFRFRTEMGIRKYNKQNGHSNCIKEKEENNIGIECPIHNDIDKPYYDYQSEQLLHEFDENINDGLYDLSDADDIKSMLKTFIKKAKSIYSDYENTELIEMFKEHYKLAS